MCPAEMYMERPPTSRGRRASAGNPLKTMPDDEHEEAGTRPKTGRGRCASIERRSSMQSDSTTSSIITPSPPPGPPSGRSSKSARRRAMRAMSQDSISFDEAGGIVQQTSSTRPPSVASLNRYTPLPGIQRPSSSEYNTCIPSEQDGRHQDGNITVIDAQTGKLSIAIKDSEQIKETTNVHPKRSPDVKKPSQTIKEPDGEDTLFRPLTRKIHLPPEPGESEKQIILAVKLPDGSRALRAFRPTDTLKTVLNFAESVALLDFTGCELICSAPHRIFKNLKVSLEDSDIQSRTVLHISLPDE